MELMNGSVDNDPIPGPLMQLLPGGILPSPPSGLISRVLSTSRGLPTGAECSFKAETDQPQVEPRLGDGLGAPGLAGRLLDEAVN